MVFHQFPDLQWLKNQAETSFQNRKAWHGRTLPSTGWPSVVMNVKTSQTFRDNIRGPLSLFANVTGSSLVHIGSKVTKVNDRFFFVSNQDQHYTLEVNPRQKTETINIHFGEYWADQVLRTLTASHETLLDEGIFTTPHCRLELHNKLYERTGSLNRLLLELKDSEGDALKEEEKLYDVLVQLIAQARNDRKIEATLPSVKNATRKEIFRRLSDATDYIYSNPQNEISLDDLARISCLSKFHFLRLFKTAFGKTPHQFVTEVKIGQATSLLISTKLEVQSIAKELGFKDSSTFSRLYFNRTGRYPSQIR
ncbi:MAG TPA: AraC family transcriptional regulator [Chryseosolibacter sp.]